MPLPYLVAGLATLALGAYLLYLDVGSRTHRAFALFLFFRGLAAIANAFQRLPSLAPDEAQLVARLIPYLLLPIVPTALYFALVYRRARIGPRLATWGGATLVALTLLVEVAYLLDHRLLWSTVPAALSPGPYSNGGGGLAYADYGPLVLVIALLHPSLALLALLFARAAGVDAPGPRRRSHLLVAAGFTLNGLFDGTIQLVAALPLLQGETYPWWAWGWTRPVLANLTLPLSLAALVLIARAGRGEASRHDRAAIRRFLWFAPAPVLSALALPLLAEGGATLATPLSFVILGAWRLALPFVVGYALVRYQLFDLNVRLKITIRRGTLAAPFVAIFFIVSKVGENFLSEQFGILAGGVSAGLLLFALRPLEVAATSLADRAMPRTKSMEALSSQERVALYRDQVTLAWTDGSISRKERLMLDVLRERLGLSHEDAARLEAAALRA